MPSRMRLISALSIAAALILGVLGICAAYNVTSTDIEPSSLRLNTYLLYTVCAALCALCVSFILTGARHAARARTADQDMQRIKTVLDNRLAAMDLSIDGVFIVDQHGILRYMNKAMMKLLHIWRSAVWKYIDKPWVNLFPEDVQDSVLNEAMTHLQDHEQWHGEYLFQHNTQAKTVELFLARLPDGGFLGTNRDLTERMKGENERQALESQFYQAQKMEAIGRLAGGVAHDFNNILAAINGYTEFLIEDLSDRPAEQKFAKKIMSATEQARALVDQILTFSRRNETRAETVDLVKVLNEDISMIRASAMATIDVQHAIEMDHAYVTGNATQISQIIMNLCVNALDAMEGEHGLLRIDVKPFDKAYVRKMDMIGRRSPGEDSLPPVNIKDGTQADQTILTMGYIEAEKEYICISVADTGTGIPREVMEQAFEPFFTTKPVDKGTGLGLSTVQGVIAEHHGAMIVDSIVGLGTRFNLYFPAEQDLNAVQEETAPAITDIQYKGARILLVEDQGVVREMTEKMLDRLGFKVTAAANGREALEGLRAHHKHHPFDLVLTDHAMPHMTGLELAQECHLRYPGLPIIIASGYSREKLQSVMEDYPGIKAVLRKPVTRDDLKQQIHIALSKKQAPRKGDKTAGAGKAGRAG